MIVALNINDSAAVKHTQRLLQMQKSDLPIAVRQALNSAAFDVKQNTMPEASMVFIHRKPTFFQANSKVVQARGFEIGQMRSTIGFVPKADSRDTSVSDLEQQEEGGDISGRAFIPLKENRVGSSWAGNVRAAGRWRRVQNQIVDANDSKAKNDAGKVKSSAKYAGVGGLVIGTKVNSNGNRMVWRIMALGAKMKLQPMFVVKKGRKVNPKATHFMRKASIKSGLKLEEYYVKHAEQRISKMK